MKAEFKQIHSQADKLYHRFNDVADDINAAAMQTIKQELKEIVEMIESDRDPRAIEDRIKQAQRDLSKLKEHGETMMSYDDADGLRDQYEDLREELQKAPGY